MTQRRIVLPDRTYLLTRRTTQRHFLLAPDGAGKIGQVFWYCTALAASATGVEVHAVQVLSNHIHEVVTDRFGNLPQFVALRNRLLALCIKRLRDWPEEVFSKASTDWLLLDDPNAIVQAIAYTTVNCVEAGLVESPEDWPGAKVLVNEIGERVIRVRRPDVYFSKANPKWPEFIDLAISMPRTLLEAHGSLVNARVAIQAEVERSLVQARAKRRQCGLAFLGRRRVLQTHPKDRPQSREREKPSRERRGSAQAKVRREFNAQYDEAWRRWSAKDRDAVFPAGTWKMWLQHGALRDSPSI